MEEICVCRRNWMQPCRAIGHIYRSPDASITDSMHHGPVSVTRDHCECPQ